MKSHDFYKDVSFMRVPVVCDASRLFPEKVLQTYWMKRVLCGRRLTLADGAFVEILEAGEFNTFEGPDFRHAVIRFGGQICSGDVEIHYFTSDWHRHGHSDDPRYNNVILHVVFEHDGVKSGPDIPVLELKPFWNCRVFAEGQEVDYWCRSHREHVPAELIRAYARKRGHYRLHRKARFFQGMNPRSSWEQIMYTAVMEALGYSRNRRPFIELAQRMPAELATLIATTKGADAVSALLMGVAGFFERVEHRRRHDQLLELWKSLQPVKKLRPLRSTRWAVFGLRPANHPVRRIIGFGAVLQRCPKGLLAHSLRILEGRDSLKLLQALFTVSDNSDAFIGRQRAFEIVVNAVIPVTLAFLEASGQREQIDRLYDALQKWESPEDNKILREMRRLFRMPSKSVDAVSTQGLIEIHKQCRRGVCDGCEIFRFLGDVSGARKSSGPEVFF